MTSGKIVLHAIKMAAKCADEVSISMTMDTIIMSKMAQKRSRKGGQNASMITALLASADTCG